MDDREKQQELEKLQEELKSSGLSRRKFLDRLKAAGIGFGAFAVLGNEAAQAHTGEAVSLNSSNPAIGNIIDEGREQAAEGEDERTQVAYRRYYYRRYYRRYRRYYYRRYGRHYYRRYYRRYGRFYF
ncbi:MAG: hypothetical protein KDJ29_11240 [Hyphomicrobiales bacterium]|nr:hypothetical protein [Hyphomicrobiales bacterium]